MKTVKPLRWTLNKAASEFAIGPKGLSSSLKAKNIRPGRDGRFSTGQIVQAIFDSEYDERLRLVREQADHKALQNQEMRSSLVDVHALAACLAKPLEAMKLRILCAYKLLDAEKDELLLDLNALWKAALTDEAPTRPGAKRALEKAKRKHNDDNEE
jgi:hypothetical protein